MTVNSQFLFFYIDELIKHHWVNWLEGPLAEVPSEEHRGIRGFQGAVGDKGAGPRTRAGEAYQLGILSGRIVRPQVAGASFPSGWQSVVDGRVPSTKLGFYSYIIGKALRENPTDPNLERALDCLASIFVLHIGFQTDGRWFNTALVFQFAYNQLENDLGRILTDIEARYLAAAVINTLDSNEREILLDPYIADQQLDRLRFDLNDGQTVYFAPRELTTIVGKKKIGINDFEKTKAVLFWAKPPRGIYTRAARSNGIRLIQALIKVDQQLARDGKANLLEETLSAIKNNHENPGIFSVAERAFADFSGLSREWQELESELFYATNKAVEAIDLDTVPAIWITSQNEIRGIATTKTIAEGIETESSQEQSEKSKGAKVGSVKDENAPEFLKAAKKKPFKKLDLPSQKAIRDLIGRELANISEAPPLASSAPEAAKRKGKPRVTQINFAEKDARNRELGEAGEFFVYQYEIQKLIEAGQEELAERVKWVSKEVGDGLGYDIRSFDLDGVEVFLEVKTTTSGRATPFFVSNHEVAVSEEKANAYRLVRVFNFPDQPRLFTLAGSLSDVLELEATSYRARVL